MAAWSRNDVLNRLLGLDEIVDADTCSRRSSSASVFSASTANDSRTQLVRAGLIFVPRAAEVKN